MKDLSAPPSSQSCSHTTGIAWLSVGKVMTSVKCVGFWELEGWQVEKIETQNVALPGPLAQGHCVEGLSYALDQRLL